jgi:hypothetical protein
MLINRSRRTGRTTARVAELVAAARTGPARRCVFFCRDHREADRVWRVHAPDDVRLNRGRLQWQFPNGSVVDFLTYADTERPETHRGRRFEVSVYD